jgi:hypothetical protein
LKWAEKRTVIARGLRRLADAIGQSETQEMLMKDFGKALTGLATIVKDQDGKIAELTGQLAALKASEPDAEDQAALAAANAAIAGHGQ